MKFDELVASYGDKVHRSSNEVYVPMDISRAFLEDVCRQKIGIIGIEIFRIEDKRIHPRIDWIADWSSVLKEKRGIEATIAKLRQLSLDFLDEVPDEPLLYANFCCLDTDELVKAIR